MSTNEIDCPREVRPELEIQLRSRPENSKLLACADRLKFYQLKKNYNDGYYAILDSYGSPPVIETVNGKCDFQFVILRKENRLKLLISKAPHGLMSNQAETVVAAGDIHTLRDQEGNLRIREINDQSGTYFIANTDPLLWQKKYAAKAAMSAVGFPMDKFVPFGAPAALVFSSTLRDNLQNTKFTKLPEPIKQESILEELESETYSPS